MTETLVRFAKQHLKNNLILLPKSYQLLFKRMYSHNNINLDIMTVVDNMPDEKLDWAVRQVENSLKKLNI